MPKIINIFLSVIDNLGDIGFACELVRSFHETYPGQYIFRIWTDDREKTELFFEVNKDDIAPYEICEKESFTMGEGEVLFLLFHHPLPDNLPKRRLLILRIDYLSFDKKWIRNHGKEHLASTPSRQIIEIIPSPLPGSGGVITPTEKLLDRKILGAKFGLDPNKRWISIFAYEETFVGHLIIEELPDTELLILGSLTSRTVSPETSKRLPFLSLIECSSIIKESEWAIVRGEVSFISTLQSRTPLMWDMYKDMGGFHSEQAQEYLEWIEADEAYRDIFTRLNRQKSGTIQLSELNHYFRTNTWNPKGTKKNLVEEMQKYIDSFYISL